MRWHEPKCIISHWFETKREWWDAWTLTKENQQGLGYRLGSCCKQGKQSKELSIDRNEESRVEFKFSGTRVYGTMEDNTLIKSILKEIQSGLKLLI